MEDGREGRLPGLLYADDLVLSGESEEDLRAMVGRFFEVCRNRVVESAEKSSNSEHLKTFDSDSIKT